MGSFFSRMQARFRQFMVGRYGSDQFSRFMLLLAFIFVILSYLFRGVWFLSLFVWVLLILVYLRMFSRNIQARYNENTRYLMAKEKVVGFFKGRRSASANGGSSYTGSQNSHGSYRSDEEHRIFRCPKCEQRVRVPRGKGRIEITCPKCGHHFTKRS